MDFLLFIQAYLLYNTHSMNKKIFIGVAWPYVNGELHIGHLAGYLLPADICARYNRLIGNDVLMVSGSDCFGTPITVEADKKGVSPAEIVKEYHQRDVHLFEEVLDLTYDLYTLTNHENHIKVTQDFFIKFLEQGLLFSDKTKQYFSPTENRFLPDRYVVGECPYCGFKDARSDQCDNCGKLLAQGELKNPLSNLKKEPVELRETEHYFIDWPKLQSKLKDFVAKSSPAWREWVKTETLGWLEEGLQPRPITRDLDWGVPIPVDRIPKDKLIAGTEHKRIYVWFDAVIGYYSASLLWATINDKDYKPFWYNKDAYHYYFMGQDNLVFHTLFWPGQLMTFNSELHLPDNVVINRFLNFDGKQFSKSRGHIISSEEIVKKYGNDLVRFYLTLIMPETRESSFNWADFKEKTNGILVANLGNFVHRTLSLCKGFTPKESLEVAPEVYKIVADAFSSAHQYLQKCEFRAYLETILQLSSYGNALVDKEKVWDLKKTNEARCDHVLTQLSFIVLALAYLIAPLLPNASGKLLHMLGRAEDTSWPEQGKETEILASKTKTLVITSNPKPLFTKLEEDAGL
jgi:methionyl-tRNA synthetase